MANKAQDIINNTLVGNASVEILSNKGGVITYRVFPDIKNNAQDFKTVSFKLKELEKQKKRIEIDAKQIEGLIQATKLGIENVKTKSDE